MNKFNLALVTGATSGIGEAMAYLLADKGIDLLITGRSVERLEAIEKELKKKVNVTTLIADLSIDSEREVLIKKINRLKPDLVINNAGFGLYGLALSQPILENINMINLNVTALTHLTLESAKTLIESNKQGVILNVSSASDLLVFPGFAVYAASKAFVTQFSQSLDIELKEKGVRVLVACPGIVRTHFRLRAAKKTSLSQYPHSMKVSFAANQLWKQIIDRKTIHYFDWKTRGLLFVARYIFPKPLLAKFLLKNVTCLCVHFLIASFLNSA